MSLPAPAAGRLLVATPLLVEETFLRTVVLLLQHDGDGSLGVVLNRPTDVPVAEVLPGWGAAAAEPAVVFRGGPVGADGALAVAAPPAGRAAPAAFRPVVAGHRGAGALGLVDLEAPAAAADLAAVRVFAGYAGWSAGQLDGELAEGAWFVAEPVPGEPFTADPAGLWPRVLRRQPGPPALASTWLADPGLN